MNINKLIKKLLELKDAGITDVFGELDCRKRIIMDGGEDEEEDKKELRSPDGRLFCEHCGYFHQPSDQYTTCKY